MEDGRKLVLASLRLAPGFALQPATLNPIYFNVTNRYGFQLGDMEDDEHQFLRHRLLREGKAFIRYDLFDESRDSALPALEAEARAASSGVWQKKDWVLMQHDAHKHIGTYRIVRGKVLGVQVARRYAYVNFDNRWKTDFTIRIPLKNLKSMTKAGFDLEGLEGRMVETRGWIFEANGPMIQVTRLEEVRLADEVER